MIENNFVKITNAAYKVLDFFPDVDPLKNKAKEKVLAILDNLTLISDAKGWVSLKKEMASGQLLDDIEVLENYLKLGKYQGWIDSVNFLIITKEYNKIKSEINPPKGVVRQGLEIVSGPNKVEESLSQGLHSKTLKTPQTQQTIKDITEDYPEKQNSLSQGAASYPVSSNATARQEKILQILTDRGKAQVANIINELPNITKRTIRRDLGNLLKSGKIMRVGEFNQVFYIIAKNTNKNVPNATNLPGTRVLS